MEEPISEADYFVRAHEFGSWLSEERGKFLDELGTEKARKEFGKFVEKWNAGVLPATLQEVQFTASPKHAAHDVSTRVFD